MSVIPISGMILNKNKSFYTKNTTNNISYFAIGETRNTLDSLSSFAEYSKPVTNGILELTSKLKDSSIVPAIPFSKINPTNIIQSVG